MIYVSSKAEGLSSIAQGNTLRNDTDVFPSPVGATSIINFSDVAPTRGSENHPDGRLPGALPRAIDVRPSALSSSAQDNAILPGASGFPDSRREKMKAGTEQSIPDQTYQKLDAAALMTSQQKEELVKK